jgi:hypothetical protein
LLDQRHLLQHHHQCQKHHAGSNKIGLHASRCLSAVTTLSMGALCRTPWRSSTNPLPSGALDVVSQEIGTKTACTLEVAFPLWWKDVKCGPAQQRGQPPFGGKVATSFPMHFNSMLPVSSHADCRGLCGERFERAILNSTFQRSSYVQIKSKGPSA